MNFRLEMVIVVLEWNSQLLTKATLWKKHSIYIIYVI